MPTILLKHEVCEIYRIKPKTLDYYIATDQIPYVRIGKRNLRFDDDELRQWFRAGAMVKYHRPRKK